MNIIITPLHNVPSVSSESYLLSEKLKLVPAEIFGKNVCPDEVMK
jgi:hypothetical protein